MSLISKSSYIRGLQCTKKFYLNYFHDKFNIKRDVIDTKVFDIGYEVGDLALQLFPGGVDCGYLQTNDKYESLELTKKYIAEGHSIIYEAAFEYDGLLCFADIMVKEDNNWTIYEVKSTTTVKDYHINDCSFQYYIISHILNVKDIYVVHLNNKYIRNGAIDISQLFTKESVLKEVLELQNNIIGKADELKRILTGAELPIIAIGKQCSKPFHCDFHSTCWKDVPEYSVFDISYIGKKKYELYSRGIVKIEDIPLDFEISDKSQLEVACYLSKSDFIDKPAIKEFLDKITYPLYYIDFETLQPHIPLFDNSRPYQQIPFQFSVHLQSAKDSEPVHYEFLANADGSDPRGEFINKLLSIIEIPGTILVYNAQFEAGRLKDIALSFPDLEFQIKALIDCMVDLMEPFRSKAYYKPAMKGSYSLKSVLPAIASNFDYSDLVIQDGSSAQTEFEKLQGIADLNAVNLVRKNLLEYCKRDTLAMVILLKELYKL